MSPHQETPSEQHSTERRDFDSWRQEIAGFCRQTVSDLQQLLEMIKESGDTSVDGEPVERPAYSGASTTADTVPNTVSNTVPSTRRSSSPSVPRDLDASQDRLATLKRELAEKLSNVARDDRRG